MTTTAPIATRTVRGRTAVIAPRAVIEAAFAAGTISITSGPLAGDTVHLGAVECHDPITRQWGMGRLADVIEHATHGTVYVAWVNERELGAAPRLASMIRAQLSAFRASERRVAASVPACDNCGACAACV